jgi:hypothetical protein
MIINVGNDIAARVAEILHNKRSTEVGRWEFHAAACAPPYIIAKRPNTGTIACNLGLLTELSADARF